jgi:Peptidase M50B-like
MWMESPNFRRRALWTAAGAFAFAFVLWNVPQLSALMYPFRLFVTFVHETGHGLAAILSGGALGSFEVYADGSGLARTAGGNLALILPAGYLGAALFGAVLFYLTNTVQHTRVITGVLGGYLIVMTVLFTGILSTAFLVGIIGGVVLVYVAARGNSISNLLILNVLALLTAFHALLDLLYLIGNSGAGLGDVRNDAAAFSAAFAPIVPGAVWAALWAGLAVVMMATALYWSIIRPLRRKRGDLV